MRRLSIIFLMMVLLCAVQTAAAVELKYYGETGSYELVERSDLRRYDNGRYTGMTSREVRSFVNPVPAPSGAASSYKNNSWFQGHFLVLEETKTRNTAAAQGINEMYPSLFHIAADGTLTVVPNYTADSKYRRDTGFPTYRNFPMYPKDPVFPGSTWTNTAYRAVDPLQTGIFTKLQMVVQYTYVGDEVYKGIPVHRLTAKWATRYGSGTLYQDYDGDRNLAGAIGTHDAVILVSVETGAAIMIRDNLDETFTYKNGQSVRFAGSTLLFTEYMPVIDTTAVAAALAKIASVVPSSDNESSTGGKKPSSEALLGADSQVEAEGTAGSSDAGDEDGEKITDTEQLLKTLLSLPDVETSAAGSSGLAGYSAAGSDMVPKNNMVVEATDAGIRLSVRDIRFVADSAQVLTDEKWRLDEIAAVLKLMPGRTFLVEGHSASTGNPSGEQRLSEERAKKIVEELAMRGIPESQFLYTGRGSEVPLADNRTSEGKAQNRRVEITILD